MTEDQFNQAQKDGKVEFLKPVEVPAPEENKRDYEQEPFIAVLEAMRRPKLYLTTAPTFTPKNFLEQIQFYDDGVDRRIYFYLNGSWSYVTLT